MRIFCDYCQKPFEINEDELDDWITLDPSDGSKVVMCGQCESRPTQRALDFCPTCDDTGYRRVSPTILAKCSCQHGQSQ